MPACDFTYSHYEEILDLINKSDYKVTFFNESCSGCRELLLRHDVDLDLEKAYTMALLENKHGIRATYFIMVRSPFYNIFDRNNSDYVKGILNLGHQIGLHFDEAYYGSNDAEDIAKNVDSEAALLKDCFDSDIFAVSFHRPSKLLLQSDIRLNANLINTYGRKYTEGFKYISDSRRMWKESCLCSLFEKNDSNSLYSGIQALVHPVWWTEEAVSTQDIMERFLLKKLEYLDSELEKNVRIYRKLF
jgi:hypothetical protein